MADISEILQSVFHLPAFRPGQSETISDVLAGSDVVCIMPTGAGKSLCYQLPAVVTGGLSLIVSPLISLMSDQVRQLRQLGLSAMFLNSSQETAIQREVLRRLQAGFRGMLYVAPERFAAPSFQRALSRLNVKLFVVDEAHCVSFWGHDFRPEYMRLAEVRAQLGSPVTLAVTATATAQVRRDIVSMLGLRSPKLHVTGFDRPNLAYLSRRFADDEEKDAALLRFISARPGSGIVYCSTRRIVEELAALLQSKLPNRSFSAYHAGMDSALRKQSQAQFMNNADAVIVATNAFGMGINKPDIRFVVHYNLPGSIEAYYQEAGRAGRDGLPADCVLFHSKSDLRTQYFFVDHIGDNNSALTDAQIAQLQDNARQKLHFLLRYASSVRCRRRQIMEYFGQVTPIIGCRCDACQSPAPRYIRPEQRSAQAASTKTKAYRAEPIVLDPAGETRFEVLRKVRKQIADENGWPAFCIMHDRVLRDVARVAPRSIAELAAIKGVGPVKAARFGPAFLASLRNE